jgi:hypothetical protein
VLLLNDEQRRGLVEHALDCNCSHGSDRLAEEDGFADVIADLSMRRSVASRELFISFLWQRVTSALRDGTSERAHWVWSVAVGLLEQLGEDLDDIFIGRRSERVLDTRWAQRG